MPATKFIPLVFFLLKFPARRRHPGQRLNINIEFCCRSSNIIDAPGGTFESFYLLVQAAAKYERNGSTVRERNKKGFPVGFMYFSRREIRLFTRHDNAGAHIACRLVPTERHPLPLDPRFSSYPELFTANRSWN